MIKKLLSILIPVAILATVVNDAGFYLVTRHDLSQTTQEAVQAAADAAHSNLAEPTATWQVAEHYARKSGAEVYGFEIKGGNVHIWTKQQVEHLWLLGYITAAATHEDLKTPILLDDDAVALIQ